MLLEGYKKYVKRLSNIGLLNRIIIDSSAYSMLTKDGRDKFDISYAEMLDRFKEMNNIITQVNKEGYN